MLRLGLARAARVARPARGFIRREMSASAKTTPKSDMPWIIGSSAIFIPAFLYVTSEAAFPEHHDVASATHDTKHDSKPHEEKTQEPETPAVKQVDDAVKQVKVREGELSTEELTAAIEKSLSSGTTKAVDEN